MLGKNHSGIHRPSVEVQSLPGEDDDLHDRHIVNYIK
jgi:hypothetical protein